MNEILSSVAPIPALASVNHLNLHDIFSVMIHHKLDSIILSSVSVL